MSAAYTRLPTDDEQGRRSLEDGSDVPYHNGTAQRSILVPLDTTFRVGSVAVCFAAMVMQATIVRYTGRIDNERIAALVFAVHGVVLPVIAYTRVVKNSRQTLMFQTFLDGLAIVLMYTGGIISLIYRHGPNRYGFAWSSYLTGLAIASGVLLFVAT